MSVGTNYLQSEYEELKKERLTDMTEEEAKIFINKEYGFEASRIDVHMDAIVAVFDESERNGVPVWRPTQLYSRKPLYSAPDHNYIRFNVCGNQYEICDGQLYFYID